MMDSDNSKEKNIKLLYIELDREIESNEYERAIKLCNKLLNLNQKDFAALHCKIVCLLLLSKFEDCLTTISKNPQSNSNLYFEKAYAEYRMGESENALQTIELAPVLTPELKELKAQVLYRFGKYKECYQLYREIIKNTYDDYDEERQINISAIGTYINPGDELPEPDLNTYEIVFNKACKYMFHSQYTEAEKLLEKCRQMAYESLNAEDEYTTEEIELELAFLRTQLAYCLQKQHRNKEAQMIYIDLLKLAIEEEFLLSIIFNNLVSINKIQNLFDSKKKMRTAIQGVTRHKTHPLQAKIIHKNQCLLLYHLKLTDTCLRQCEKLIEMFPEEIATITVLRALFLCRDDKTEDAINLLSVIAEKHPEHNLYLQLVATQILLDNKDILKACEQLQQLGKDKYKPGIVSALVSLYISTGDEASAAKVFEETVTWYNKYQGEQVDVGNMWMHAAEFHMKYGNPAVAVTCLEKLYRIYPKNKRILAKLVMAYLKTNNTKAELLSSELPTIDELIENLDCKELEISPYVHGLKYSRNKHELSPSGITDIRDVKKKKKNKSKTQLPPGVYLDPDRWLPKHERSGFRKKRDRRNKDVIKGSQGSAQASNEPYDFSGKIVEKEEEFVDCSETLKPSPASATRKLQPQKKKKKMSRK